MNGFWYEMCLQLVPSLHSSQLHGKEAGCSILFYAEKSQKQMLYIGVH